MVAKEVEELWRIASIFFPDNVDAALSQILRWRKYNPAYYRQDVYVHSNIVALLAAELEEAAISYFGKGFDIYLASIFAKTHDHPEIFTGDVPKTAKLSMTIEEKMELHEKELLACDMLAERYGNPMFNGFGYKKVLLDYIAKEKKESHFVSLLDQVSAVCEVLHELIAGNKAFDGSGAVPAEAPPCFTYLRACIPDTVKKFNLEGLFSYSHPLLAIPFEMDESDIERLISSGKPHTRESIREPTGIKAYDSWKQVVIKGGYEDVLVLQREWR